ncbi:hypothetical protein [Duck adenovirus 1]|nr:hypothetical protein [Duck adenovirus 1]WPT09561.1 hypothetical protein [Duck adenovirus 1]
MARREQQRCSSTTCKLCAATAIVFIILVVNMLLWWMVAKSPPCQVCPDECLRVNASLCICFPGFPTEEYNHSAAASKCVEIGGRLTDQPLPEILTRSRWSYSNFWIGGTRHVGGRLQCNYVSMQSKKISAALCDTEKFALCTIYLQ